MTQKVGIGGPRGFILGLIVGVFLTLAYQYLTAKPVENTEQRALGVAAPDSNAAK